MLLALVGDSTMTSAPLRASPPPPPAVTRLPARAAFADLAVLVVLVDFAADFAADFLAGALGTDLVFLVAMLVESIPRRATWNHLQGLTRKRREGDLRKTT
jgi:hypothetical protein